MLCEFQVYSKVILLYIYINIYTLFLYSLPYMLLQDIEYSLCYKVGPCWLSILYIVVCMF